MSIKVLSTFSTLSMHILICYFPVGYGQVIHPVPANTPMFTIQSYLDGASAGDVFLFGGDEYILCFFFFLFLFSYA